MTFSRIFDNSNTTDAIYRAGTAYPSWAHAFKRLFGLFLFISVFVPFLFRSFCSIVNFLCSVLPIIIFFVTFLPVIVLSGVLPLTCLNDPFVTFKLFITVYLSVFRRLNNACSHIS